MASVGDIILQPRGVSTQLFELPPECGIAFGDWTTLPTASEEFRGIVVRTEGGAGVADQIVVCRKNADDAYEWVPLAPAQTSIVVHNLQTLDEAINPHTYTGSQILDPYASLGSLSFYPYRYARLRMTLSGAGTAGSTLQIQVSTDGGNVYAGFLDGGTLDTSQTSVTTAWEAIPAPLIDAGVFCYLQTVHSGGAALTYTANVILDLKG